MVCRDCYAYPHCGGLDNLFAAIGCCHGCAPGTCDYTCPNNEQLYRLRLAQVRGLDEYNIAHVRAAEPAGLPRYIPLIHHGSSRQVPLVCNIAAVPLFKVLCHRTRATYGSRFQTADELRRYFKIHNSAQIILCGVAPDRQLEWFWHWHRKFDVAKLLAQLGCFAVTIPNFSFFSDYPRWHILYNRKRLLLVIERLSSAGVAVIPHLNAITPADWDFWLGFLQEHKCVTLVAKEFQTGNRSKRPGDESFDQLARLQDRLGRPLHPILIGAGRYYARAHEKFKAFSIMDSRPFLQTLNRTRLIEFDYRWGFVSNHLPRGHPVDELLAYNISKYSEKLATSAPNEAVISVAADGNLVFGFINSMPIFTAQPVAPEIS